MQTPYHFTSSSHRPQFPWKVPEPVPVDPEMTVYPQRNGYTISRRSLHPQVRRDVIHNCQTMEMAHIHQHIDRAWYIYVTGVLFSLQNERHSGPGWGKKAGCKGKWAGPQLLYEAVWTMSPEKVCVWRHSVDWWLPGSWWKMGTGKQRALARAQRPEAAWLPQGDTHRK